MRVEAAPVSRKLQWRCWLILRLRLRHRILRLLPIYTHTACALLARPVHSSRITVHGPRARLLRDTSWSDSSCGWPQTSAPRARGAPRCGAHTMLVHAWLGQEAQAVGCARAWPPRAVAGHVARSPWLQDAGTASLATVHATWMPQLGWASTLARGQQQLLRRRFGRQRQRRTSRLRSSPPLRGAPLVVCRLLLLRN